MSDQALRPMIILGPTAGGKSELAVTLAEQFNGEIIGADSMQIYRHLDAGTAKPSAHQQSRVRHHLIDMVEPTSPFSVADWLELAEPLIKQLQAANKRPIIVGGTNLYLKALLFGMFQGPPADLAVRETLADQESQALHRQLKEVDPQAAERIHPNDRKRLTRALEVFLSTGKPISVWQKQWQDENITYRFNPVLIGLQWPVEQINLRINYRVKAMFYPERVHEELAAEICPKGESLPVEARRLFEASLLGTQASQAIGYKQVIDFIEERFTLDEAFEKTKIATRRLGKQQRTWLRRFRGIYWVTPETQSMAEMVAHIKAAAADAKP